MKSGSAEFGSVGSKYGAKTVTQTEAQMPSHTHIQNPHAHAPNSSLSWLMSNRTASTNASGGGSATLSDYSTSTANTTATNQNTGGGQAMNNIQPTVAALLVIKT